MKQLLSKRFFLEYSMFRFLSLGLADYLLVLPKERDMSKLVSLISAIKTEVDRINQSEEDTRTPLASLLIRSIDKTMVEIKRGANSEDFPDLTVINLIIMGAQEGYAAGEMRGFIEELKAPEIEDHL
jgi:hypothetical protein